MQRDQIIKGYIIGFLLTFSASPVLSFGASLNFSPNPIGINQQITNGTCESMDNLLAIYNTGTGEFEQGFYTCDPNPLGEELLTPNETFGFNIPQNHTFVEFALSNSNIGYSPLDLGLTTLSQAMATSTFVSSFEMNVVSDDQETSGSTFFTKPTLSNLKSNIGEVSTGVFDNITLYLWIFIGIPLAFYLALNSQKNFRYFIPKNKRKTK